MKPFIIFLEINENTEIDSNELIRQNVNEFLKNQSINLKNEFPEFYK